MVVMKIILEEIKKRNRSKIIKGRLKAIVVKMRILKKAKRPKIRKNQMAAMNPKVIKSNQRKNSVNENWRKFLMK